MEAEELKPEQLIKIPATVAHLLRKFFGHWIWNFNIFITVNIYFNSLCLILKIWSKKPKSNSKT